MLNSSVIRKWNKRVALVTGASSGIGASICVHLVKHGMTVIGCSRRKPRIDKMAEQQQATSGGSRGNLVPYQCDLSKEQDIEEMFAWIKEHYSGVDVCVNNAGVAIDEDLLECSAGPMRAMLDVNVVALVLCSKFAFHSMRERDIDDGHIINISSMGGHRLSGRWNFYSSTKFAVTAITESVRRELVVHSKIRVTAISPGLVETEAMDHSYGKIRSREVYASTPHIKPHDVAGAVLFVLATPAQVQVHDILLRATGSKI